MPYSAHLGNKIQPFDTYSITRLPRWRGCARGLGQWIRGLCDGRRRPIVSAMRRQYMRYVINEETQRLSDRTGSNASRVLMERILGELDAADQPIILFANPPASSDISMCALRRRLTASGARLGKFTKQTFSGELVSKGMFFPFALILPTSAVRSDPKICILEKSQSTGKLERLASPCRPSIF
jgi:hypothetical protein